MPAKTKIIFALLLIAWIPLLAAQKKSQGTSPSAVVNQFYKYHFAHDMGFTDKTYNARAKWLTPEAREASKKYLSMPENPDEPPYIDGDPFTGSQEYPNRFVVGAESVSDTTARVPVTFTWKADGHSTKATVLLKNIDGIWLIDDVTFTDQDSFRKLLSDAVKQ